MKKRIFFILSGIIISCFFLYLALRKVEIKTVWEIIKSAHWPWLLAAFFTFSSAYLIRSLRWYFLYLPLKKCRFLDLLSILVIGFMSNNLLPLRAGEFIRAWLSGHKEKVSKSSALATIVMERGFDGLAMLLLLTCTLLLYSFPAWVKKIGWFAFFLFSLFFIFLVLLLKKREKALSLVENALPFLPQKARSTIQRWLSSFIEGLQILKQKKELFAVSLLSLLVWLAEGTTFWLISLSLKMNLALTATIFIMLIIGLALIVPSSPGFIGVYEYAGVTALAVFGISKTRALSFILLVHTFQFSLIVVIGLLFLWRENLTLSQLAKTEVSEKTSET